MAYTGPASEGDIQVFRTIKAFILVLSFSLAPAFNQSITAREAASHVGQRATVCGKIAGEHTAYRSNGRPTFIDIDQPYPNQIFTVLIWGEDRANVGDLPRKWKILCNRHDKGIQRKPEMIIRNAKSWYVPK